MLVGKEEFTMQEYRSNVMCTRCNAILTIESVYVKSDQIFYFKCWKCFRDTHVDGPLNIDRFRFFIPKEVTPYNKWHGRHWSYYDKIRGIWLVLMQSIIGNWKEEIAKFKFVKIHCIRKRKVDPLNLDTTVKYIPDILQRLGWIRDDSEKWAKIKVTQDTRGRKKKGVARPLLGVYIEISERDIINEK